MARPAKHHRLPVTSAKLVQSGCAGCRRSIRKRCSGVRIPTSRTFLVRRGFPPSAEPQVGDSPSSTVSLAEPVYRHLQRCFVRTCERLPPERHVRSWSFPRSSAPLFPLALGVNARESLRAAPSPVGSSQYVAQEDKDLDVPWYARRSRPRRVSGTAALGVSRFGRCDERGSAAGSSPQPGRFVGRARHPSGARFTYAWLAGFRRRSPSTTRGWDHRPLVADPRDRFVPADGRLCSRRLRSSASPGKKSPRGAAGSRLHMAWCCVQRPFTINSIRPLRRPPPPPPPPAPDRAIIFARW